MRTSTPLVVVVAAFAMLRVVEGAGLDAADELEGSWRVVSASREGAEAKDLQGHRLSFDRDRFVIRSARGEVRYRGTFKVDSTKEPPTIDFQHETQALAGKTWLGVYRLDGNKLRICDNAVDPTQPRPTGFESKPRSGSIDVTFESATP